MNNIVKTKESICWISLEIIDNKERIQPTPTENISSRTNKPGTRRIDKKFALAKKSPDMIVIIKATKPVALADIEARSGISSTGKTVLRRRLLFAVSEFAAAINVSLNIINGTSPENTRITYSGLVRCGTLTLNIRVYIIA
jgi:hypothetical protein